MSAETLEGRTILLVEDEYFQARDLKTILERKGAIVVGPTGRAEDVPALLAECAVDAALVDINLGSGMNYNTADLLQKEGVPFAFLTGYDPKAIPAELEGVPLLQKPASERMLLSTLTGLL